MKISVITVAYNAARTLTDTLESVAHQDHGDVDHWVIDGGSHDNTEEVIANHGHHLAGFISERDNGLYDAMNKGAALARGEAIGFLNADDWYAHPSVLRWVNDCFSRGADFVYGNLAFVTAESPFVVQRVWEDKPHLPRDFFRFGWQPAHPTSFIRTELFHQLGGFDTRRRIAADYAFLAATMSKPGLNIQHIPHRLTNMRLGGMSTRGLSAVWRANKECALALQEMGYAMPWKTLALKVMRKMPQVLLSRSARSKSLAEPLWRPWAVGSR